VVWGPGKTPEQIVRIMDALRDRQSVVMATRITPEVRRTLRAQGSGFRVQGQDLGFRAQGSGLRV